MKNIYSFFFLFLFFSFSLSQSTDESASQLQIDSLKQQLQALISQVESIKTDYDHHKGNLSSSLDNIQSKYNFQNLQNLIKQYQIQIDKIEAAQQNLHDVGTARQTQQDQIDTLLHQPQYILFDDSTSDPSSDTSAADEQNEIVLAEYCTRSFVELIPPSFCVKKPLELGKAQVLCADGDEDILGICYKPCSSGFVKFLTFSCQEVCSNGFHNGLPGFCSQSFWNFHIKAVHLRDSYTKLSSQAYCRAPYLKEIFLLFPLCFKDCTRIGLLNCGPHTCGMTQKICNDDIANIIKDIIIGLGKLFLDVVTFGLSGLISSILTNPTAMYNAAQKAGKAAMLQAYNNVKVWLGRIDQSKLVNQMVALTNKYVAQNSTLSGLLSADRIQYRCQSVKDIFNEKIVNTDQPNDQWKDFTSKDLHDYVKACKEANSGFACQQAIRQSVLKWDPTGIVSMISAFKQQDCPDIN